MSKKSKKINQELMPILLSPDVNITFTDLRNYSCAPHVAYFVFQADNRKFEMNIEQKKLAYQPILSLWIMVTSFHVMHDQTPCFFSVQSRLIYWKYTER